MSDREITHQDIQTTMITALNEKLHKWTRTEPVIPEQLLDTGNYPADLSRALAYISSLNLPEDQLGKLSIKKTPDGLRVEPVDIKSFLDKKFVLVHQGFLDSHVSGEWDNLDRLEHDGVIGSKDGITYLASLDDTSVIPNFTFPEDRPRRIPIVVYINPDILARWRSIYIDPEQQMEVDENGNIPYNAFFITGGIPAEAIISIQGDLDPNLF